MLKKYLSILFFVCALCFSLRAQAYTKPGNPSGFVNDFANIIDDTQQAQIENQLSAYEKETSNEITIVTIQNLGDDTIENYAVKLFEDWKIGKANNDNGLLFLIAVDDKQMRIEVGYGLEPYIVDAEAARVINNIVKPEFQNGDYTIGISKGVNAIIEAIGETDYGASQKSSVDFPWEIVFWIFFLIVTFFVRVLSKSKSWWQGGVIGIGAGALIGAFTHFLFTGLGAMIVLGGLGLLLDYYVSKNPPRGPGGRGGVFPWFIGGGRGGGSGGFGGFGGGGSGGGGASGGW
jgi:uncharacterized protein